MARIAFLGGTGPEGLGLAARCAVVGEEVVIGSRQRERADAAATQLRERLSAHTPTARVTGAENAHAIDGADIVMLCMPFAGMEPVLRELAPRLHGKILVDVVNPLVRKRGQFISEPVPAGSAGELAQQLVPEAPVVGAFKNLSAEELLELEHPLEGDVLLCGEHPEAKQRISDLVGRIPRLRAVDAGGLANSAALEAITALLMNVNRRYKATTSIRILGLPEGPLTPRQAGTGR